MAERNLISIIEVAKIHGLRRQSIHKIVKKHGIHTEKASSDDSRGQQISWITMSDYKILEKHLSNATQAETAQTMSQGVFYLVLLEPDSDPGRFKVGFTHDLDERLRKHKTVAPFLRVVKTWPCKILWERTAIDCVTEDCQKLHTEVFRADKISSVVDRADRFFELMPTLDLE